jgi:hypothetical protein
MDGGKTDGRCNNINLFHARNKYAKLAFEATGHTVTDGSVNIIENFLEIRNNLDLTRLEENKA